MWLFTKFGFFSVVQKDGDRDLTVRARVKEDLENLKDKYLPNMSKIVVGAGTDYPFRAKVSRAELAEAIKQIAMDIDYSNFKDAVNDMQGTARANTYLRVWSSMLTLDYWNRGEYWNRSLWFNRYNSKKMKHQNKDNKDHDQQDPFDPMTIARNTNMCPECGDRLVWLESGRFYYCRNGWCNFILDKTLE